MKNTYLPYLSLQSALLVVLISAVPLAFANDTPQNGGPSEIAKAWVNFNGLDCGNGPGSDECTIRDSFNVDRVVEEPLGAGQVQYVVHWDQPFANTNYATVVSSNNVSTKLDVPYLVGSVVIQTSGINTVAGASWMITAIAFGSLD